MLTVIFISKLINNFRFHHYCSIKVIFSNSNLLVLTQNITSFTVELFNVVKTTSSGAPQELWFRWVGFWTVRNHLFSYVLNTRNDSSLENRTFQWCIGEVKLCVVRIAVVSEIMRSNDAADVGRIEREQQRPEHGSLQDPAQDVRGCDRLSIQINWLSATDQVRVQRSDLTRMTLSAAVARYRGPQNRKRPPFLTGQGGRAEQGCQLSKESTISENTVSTADSVEWWWRFVESNSGSGLFCCKNPVICLWTTRSRIVDKV